MNTYLITPEIGKPFKVKALNEELALVEADETTDYDIVFVHLLTPGCMKKYTFILNRITILDRMTYDFYRIGRKYAKDIIAYDLESAAEEFGLGYDDVIMPD